MRTPLHTCIICSWCNKYFPLSALAAHRAACLPEGLGTGSKDISTRNNEETSSTSSDRSDVGFSQPDPSDIGSCSPRAGLSDEASQNQKAISEEGGSGRLSHWPSSSAIGSGRKRKQANTGTNDTCRKKQARREGFSHPNSSPQPGPSGYNPGRPATTPSPTPGEISQHFNGALTTIDVPVPPADNGDIASYFNNNTGRLREAVESVFQGCQQVRLSSFKVYVDMHLRLVREDPDDGVQYRDMYMRSHMQVISFDDIDSYVRELSEYFVNRFEHDKSDEEGSGFTLDEIVSVKFSFSLIMLHNSIGEYVPYPKGVPGKTQVLNPSGPTDCVFQVLTAYRYLKSRNVVPSGRQWENACLASINTGNIPIPVSWEDLGRLERLNNISIRVYCLDNVEDKKGELTLVRKGLKDQEVIHCLLLGNRHLALIQDFDAYMNLFTCQRRGKKNVLRYLPVRL
ncbi:uncharacterized protein LOC126980610 isoform X2 [Eriocheir sinensis]|uniref:uncharacterized protein LOC126980610 isoform X2 n=1 Tax=Eriocheir sinensis TaxID=95602 RepID=UPI0021C9C545|nr:uncharacterized protein LOC126980610 isoform X2 [Eriocheir sinensis]